jgi:hypothetical protein
MAVAVAAAVICSCAAVIAQEKPAPAPAKADAPTPRWPDGHPNLGSAPGQKGYWEVRPGGLAGRGTRAADVPFQPWAKAVFEDRRQHQLNSPLVACKPGGGPSFFNSPGFEIVEVPEMKRLFFLDIAGPHSWRVVYMDGRPHPKDARPTFLGHSVGHWDGDTLVIDTVGFNEKSWVVGSYPTTTQLHLVERITRPTLRTLTYEATIDDPGAYTKPWTQGWSITPTTSSSWIADGEIFEYICEDDRGGER